MACGHVQCSGGPCHITWANPVPMYRTCIAYPSDSMRVVSDGMVFHMFWWVNSSLKTRWRPTNPKAEPPSFSWVQILLNWHPKEPNAIITELIAKVTTRQLFLAPLALRETKREPKHQRCFWEKGRPIKTSCTWQIWYTVCLGVLRCSLSLEAFGGVLSILIYLPWNDETY
jgi:hypothetical protein